MRRSLALLLALLTGCSSTNSSAPGAPISSTTTTGEEAPRSPIAAYVVVTSEETLVVPLSEGEPARRAGGLWLLDEATSHVVRPPPDPEALGVPRCASSDATGACALPERVTLTSALDPALDPACTCFTSPDTEACGDDPFASLGLTQWTTRSAVSWQQILEHRHDENEEDDEERDYAYEGCDDSESHAVSLHGGVLYGVEYAHEGCGGLNLYSASMWSRPLAADERSVEPPAREAWTCTNDGAFLDEWATPVAAEGCTFDGDGWYDEARDDEWACSECERGDDGFVPFLRNGVLMLVGARVYGTGNGPRFTVTVAAEASCTPSDPCGALTAIEAIREQASDTALGFVAADERSGVLVESDGVSLFAAARERPIRRESLSGELLGVRYHRDAYRLVDAIDRDQATEAPRSECAAGETIRGDECVTPCVSDLDCRTTGPCDSVCLDGVCASVAVECAEGHPCAAGSRCERSVCSEIPLAPGDVAFEDTHGGSDWGNRCVAHLRAGDLDAAEAACAAGLDGYERETTHGALLYNLGLIARQRGDDWLARLYFEASLVVRPSATVEGALRDAGGPIEE